MSNPSRVSSVNNLGEESFFHKDPFIDFSMQYCLSDLLSGIDKKSGAGLRDGLKAYLMLLVAALEAINAFSSGDFNKFDPLVGENACEIRAVWVAVIASKNLVRSKQLATEILRLKLKVTSTLEPKTVSRLMESGITLFELMEHENLFINLSLEEFFIIQSYLLTEVKVSNFDNNPTTSLCIKEKCDPKKLKRFGDIFASFADNLTSKLRRFTAAASVQFARRNTFKMQNQNLQWMLSDKFTINHNNHLLCTPMFWTYKSVLSVALDEGIPLVINARFLEKQDGTYKIVDQDYLFFEPFLSSKYQPDLTYKNVIDVNCNKVAWVIQGVVCSDQNRSLSKSQWRQAILKYPISDVILAGAADHRQYPNSEQEGLINLLQNHEYETFKSFARSEGFSLDNPKMFFIQHVYPCQVGTIFAAGAKITAEVSAI